MLRWFLFNTRLGEAVLEALERRTGLCVVIADNCRSGLCMVEARALGAEPACSRLGPAAAQ